MNPKTEIAKTLGVNFAAITTSFADIEQALRILILIASLVYTTFQIRKMMLDDDEQPKNRK